MRHEKCSKKILANNVTSTPTLQVGVFLLKDNKIYLRLFEKGVKIMPNSTTSTEWKAGYACKGDLMGLPPLLRI